MFLINCNSLTKGIILYHMSEYSPTLFVFHYHLRPETHRSWSRYLNYLFHNNGNSILQTLSLNWKAVIRNVSVIVGRGKLCTGWRKKCPHPTHCVVLKNEKTILSHLHLLHAVMSNLNFNTCLKYFCKIFPELKRLISRAKSSKKYLYSLNISKLNKSNSWKLKKPALFSVVVNASYSIYTIYIKSMNRHFSLLPKIIPQV